MVFEYGLLLAMKSKSPVLPVRWPSTSLRSGRTGGVLSRSVTVYECLTFCFSRVGKNNSGVARPGGRRFQPVVGQGQDAPDTWRAAVEEGIFS